MRHNIITKGISVLALSLFMFSANAQETKQLTLNEAIELSLKNNKQLKLNTAKIDEANAALREARERRLPDLKASGSYLRLPSPTIDLKTKPASSNSGSNGSGTSEQSGSSMPDVHQVTYGMVNASVPLFTGFQIKSGIESAKYLSMAAKLDAEKDREQIIENTIAAYSNLYKAKAAVDLVKENLKQSEQRVKDFSNLEKNGLIARNDLLKVQLQESNVELTLMDAENNLKITNINMNLMLGLPESTQLVTDSASIKTSIQTKSMVEWEELAVNSRKDAQALGYREKAANAGIKAAKGAYYPTVALTGGYVAADIPNFLTITNAINGGIGVSYSPSSLWKAGSKVAQAKAKLAEVQTSEAMLNDNIRIQVNQAYQNYLVSVKKIDVYAKAVDQANENYRIVKNKQANSLATTTDLLDADVAQLQARMNYAFANADVVVAYNKLLEAAGVITNNTNNQQ